MNRLHYLNEFINFELKFYKIAKVIIIFLFNR